MFFIAESDLLHLFIGTLEAGYAFMVYPDSNWWFCPLLDSYDPIIVAIHRDDVIGVSLHEQLLSCNDVFSYEDAACGVVHSVVFENEVWVVKGAEGECWGELEERFGGENTDHSVGLVKGWDVLGATFLACAHLITFHDRIWELFRWLDLLFFQFSAHLCWIHCLGEVCEIVTVLPAATFHYLECHFFGKAVPVVNVGACVYSSDDKVGAYLDAFQGVTSWVIFDCSFTEKTEIFKVVFDVDACDGPKVSALWLKWYL